MITIIHIKICSHILYYFDIKCPIRSSNVFVILSDTILFHHINYNDFKCINKKTCYKNNIIHLSLKYGYYLLNYVVINKIALTRC